ncbi:MAG: DNA mismatch repair endonuclease MutL, partial [Muribaculaceae bacterium]|nr:DNA mismatch repair endonuclease MutL [Muribaculaceae bacterium]
MSTNPDIIRLLPDAVANQIAAGEVIQRPASVVKELVENAVDAGATSITIVIKDGGRTLIQVIDNGCGMSPADARMAFERHATSKIATAADLYALHTMGFRGEALPSIASVAQVELRTMRPGDESGTCLRISGSRFEGQEPVAATPGSNFIVRNLLFNQPGRRKFLKKDSVETGHILREFERLALVNPHIDFTLVSNDVTLHQLLHASEKQRIVDLFGKSLDRSLLPISTAAPFVRISGFIGLPSAAKKRGYQQFFGVNGRNMRHPFFHRAVMACYQPLIAADAQPSYFINFEVAPENIDVN